MIEMRVIERLTVRLSETSECVGIGSTRRTQQIVQRNVDCKLLSVLLRTRRRAVSRSNVGRDIIVEARGDKEVLGTPAEKLGFRVSAQVQRTNLITPLDDASWVQDAHIACYQLVCQARPKDAQSLNCKPLTFFFKHSTQRRDQRERGKGRRKNNCAFSWHCLLS